MKKVILSGLALAIAALASHAMAADMRRPAYKAPPPPPPVANWTGFYAGVNLGAAFTDWKDTVSPSGCFLTGACGGGGANNPFRTDSASFHNTVFTGGGQIGYNWQFNSAVVGLETDFNYNGLNATDSVSRALAAPLVGNFTHSVSVKWDYFGTLRGRLGWLVNPDWLIYATGGLAYGHIDSTSSVAFSVAPGDTYGGTDSRWRVGWTAGAGTEWRLSPAWSVKAEYLYVDLGSYNYGVPCTAGAGGFCTGFAPAPAYQTDLTVREHVARVGINYKFNWGGPVIASY